MNTGWGRVSLLRVGGVENRIYVLFSFSFGLKEGKLKHPVICEHNKWWHWEKIGSRRKNENYLFLVFLYPIIDGNQVTLKQSFKLKGSGSKTSIHPVSITTSASTQGHGGAGPNPSCTWGQHRVTAWTGWLLLTWPHPEINIYSLRLHSQRHIQTVPSWLLAWVSVYVFALRKAKREPRLTQGGPASYTHTHSKIL